MILLIVIAVVALLAIRLFASGYVSARPNEADNSMLNNIM